MLSCFATLLMPRSSTRSRIQTRGSPTFPPSATPPIAKPPIPHLAPDNGTSLYTHSITRPHSSSCILLLASFLHFIQANHPRCRCRQRYRNLNLQSPHLQHLPLHRPPILPPYSRLFSIPSHLLVLQCHGQHHTLGFAFRDEHHDDGGHECGSD